MTHLRKTQQREPTLRRALGRWDLTAIGVNQVIGGAIFLMPSQVAALVGNWSPFAFLAVGLASLFVALCFAEVGSRFERTGGPYLYTRAAFGRFAAFEVGWMQWYTRVASYASVANGVVLAIGFYRPAVTTGWSRILVLTALMGALAFINVRGIRQSAWTVNILTIGKIVPLAVFIAVGVFFMEPGRLSPLPPVTLGQASAAALLLIFAFGGYEVVPVPAGEAHVPRRQVPFALVSTILVVTAFMTAAQVVAMGTNPDLAASATPLADSAFLFMGGAGALMISLGSVVSMTGNNAGQVLTGSRMLFALAENGDLPRFFGRVHPLYRTPANAVLFTSAVAFVLAVSGSFVWLAVASAVSRLLTYAASCAATLVLRSPRFAGRVKPATFVIPFGPVVPALALLVSAAVLAGASAEQFAGGLGALAAGALLFALTKK
ncbi:MAG: APC family permease [Clostridiales bacterium]|nr:APC family permease [Clostridiales bacterium]